MREGTEGEGFSEEVTRELRPGPQEGASPGKALGGAGRSFKAMGAVSAKALGHFDLFASQKRPG